MVSWAERGLFGICIYPLFNWWIVHRNTHTTISKYLVNEPNACDQTTIDKKQTIFSPFVGVCVCLCVLSYRWRCLGVYSIKSQHSNDLNFWMQQIKWLDARKNIDSFSNDWCGFFCQCSQMKCCQFQIPCRGIVLGGRSLMTHTHTHTISWPFLLLILRSLHKCSQLTIID